jgi:hypothetical protein
MIRTLAFFGLAVAFLVISPKFRESIFGVFTGSVHGIESYAPYSYVALAVVAVGSFVVSVNRSSQPR